MVIQDLINNVEPVINGITYIISITSFIVGITNTPKDIRWYSKLYKVLEALAIVTNKTKQK